MTTLRLPPRRPPLHRALRLDRKATCPRLTVPPSPSGRCHGDSITPVRTPVLALSSFNRKDTQILKAFRFLNELSLGKQSPRESARCFQSRTGFISCSLRTAPLHGVGSVGTAHPATRTSVTLLHTGWDRGWEGSLGTCWRFSGTRSAAGSPSLDAPSL